MALAGCRTQPWPDRPELAAAPDVVAPPDLVAPPDFATPNDLAMPVDFAVPHDLADAGDLRPPAPDLARPVDLARACTPDCHGHRCGDNGCGGSCGDCGEDFQCQDGVCLVSCGLSSGAVGAPWPMFGRCPNHAGHSPFVGPRTAHLKWSTALPNIDGSPAIGADGTVYIGSEWDGILYALDGATGTIKWSAQHAYAAQNLTPALGADGSVIVPGTSGITAIDSATGQVRWTTPIMGGYFNSNSPTIGPDGTIYLSAISYVYALDPATGKVIWSYGPHDNENFSVPSLDASGGLYVGSWTGGLVALDSTNGDVRWSQTRAYCDERLSGATVDDAGALYFSDGCSRLWSIAGATGQVRWVQSIPDWLSPPSLGDGTVFTGGAYAVSTLDGQQNWYFASGVLLSKPAVDANQTVYVGSYDKALHAIDNEGHEKWRFQTNYPVFGSPAIGADGTIYLGSYDGNVYAIGNP